MNFGDKYNDWVLTNLSVEWVRYHTSKDEEGTDAVHTDCDYSAAHVKIQTNKGDAIGFGIIFTIGKGSKTCVECVNEFKDLIEGTSLGTILNDFRAFWRKMTQHSQMRWIGPEKGVYHLCVAGVVNAIWDLWGKLEQKPLWKLLSDLTPEQTVSLLDLSYVDDFLSEQDAINILKENYDTRKERIEHMEKEGYPAYTTAVGWAGYSDEKVVKLCKEAKDVQGFNAFKVKVGTGCEKDDARVGLVRKHVGPDAYVMTDANQVWSVNESERVMKVLSKHNITWIEEPTAPDDAWGHAEISKRINPLGIGVATGEHCSNRILHKQMIMLNSYQFVQSDPVRVGGMNELLVVMLMAKKAGKPVCLHAGGVGLCEMGIHAALFDYIGISASLEKRWFEYAGALHEHFKNPVQIKNGCYVLPTGHGYAADMLEESIEMYRYPSGSYWTNLKKN